VREQMMLVLHDAFQRLRWLASTRGKLRDVRRLMQVDADTGAASACTPLVRQVLTKILLRVSTVLSYAQCGNQRTSVLHLAFLFCSH
jgi:hypothetical protein